MIRSLKLISHVAVVSLGLCTATLSGAEIDTVYKKSDGKVVGGEIKSISRTAVVLIASVGRKEETIPANDVASIEFKADPTGLSLARSNERSGNLSEALAGFQDALGNGVSGNVKAEVTFLLARTSAKIAQADHSQAAAAVTNLEKFLKDHSDNFRYYEAQLLLADSALLAGDNALAEKAFAVVEQAPWEDIKMAGRLGIARGQLSRGDVSGAKAIYDSVASTNPQSEIERARRFEAILGQAACLKAQSQFADAAKTLQQVIDGVTASDTRLLAEAYLRQGDCLLAEGANPKAAVMAYLRVDVIPALAAHPDLHAEALYQLSKLWGSIGKLERGAESAARLEQEYPESEWTKKLQAGN